VQASAGLDAGVPLFTALLNYRHGTASFAHAGRLPAQLGGIEHLSAREQSSYPLVLSIDDLGRDIWLTAQGRGRISADQVAALVEQALRSLVHALEHAPATPASDLALLDEAELERILVGWNDTAAPFPATRCVHELVEAQARATPDAAALATGPLHLSYAELNRRANRLAHLLRARGAGPERLVAVCMAQPADAVIAFLAILKAGAAYLPLDPGSPAERLAYMLDDSRPAILLTDTTLDALVEDAVAGLDPSPSIIRPADERLDVLPEADIPVAASGVRPDSLAYVIYTSGSTGTPKGVMIEHRALCNKIATLGGRLAIEAGEGYTLLSAPTFDAFVEQMFLPLTRGAKLIGFPGLPRLDTRHIWDIVVTERRTTLHCTPSLMRTLMQDAPAAIPTTRIILGGDRLDSSLVSELLERWPEARIYNLYGPTEATIDAAGTVIAAGAVPDPIPIGAPLENYRIYILSSDMKPVPPGVVGEICIGGLGLARGYLNRPELTAEKFVTDPFMAGERLYRTGDVGRHRADGTIEFVGRNDDQVKVRGFRIELGEIESQLMKHAAVAEAVVVAWDDGQGDKRLLAYFTAADQAAPIPVEDLRAALSRSLPPYMVPAGFVQLAAFPITPNGKLDRKALPAPGSDAYGASSFAPPEGPVEEALAALWAELLGIEQVGRHDNFFDLGGHSLLAMRLLERMRRLGFAADVRALFSAPTLAELAARVAAPAAVDPEPSSQDGSISSPGKADA
jgi:amino acid adenylation domain-containing protein